MADQPEFLPSTSTATLRHLRAQMIAGSDMHDKLHALIGFATQLIDAQILHPARVQRDADDAVAADKAREAAAAPTLTSELEAGDMTGPDVEPPPQLSEPPVGTPPPSIFAR